MECPRSDDPRWLIDYQYQLARRVSSDLSNVVILLGNLASLYPSRWKEMYEDAEKLLERFREEYNKLICQLMSE